MGRLRHPPPGEEPAPKRCSRRRSGEEGQGMVEYALILVLIVIILIALVFTLGRQTNNFYSNIANGLLTQ